MKRRLFVKSVVLFVGLLVLGGAIGCYLFFTTAGSRQLTAKLLGRYGRVKEVTLPDAQGNLNEGFRLKNLELRDIEWLPEGSVVRIQDFVLRLAALNFAGIDLEIENARIVLPYSQPVVLFVRLKEGMITANVFAPSLNIGQIISLLPQKELKGLNGNLTDTDIHVSGYWQSPHFEGHFFVNELIREKFRAVNCPGRLALDLQIKERPKVKGQVNLEKGTLQGPRTAVIELEPSRILFQGDPANPDLNIRAQAKVEDVRITITVKGNAQKPEMDLSSEPPFFSERLLVMLATGKKWQGAEEALLNNKIPAELAKDFIDYFAFSGTGQILAERYGITDIQLKLEKDSTAVGFKKTVTERVKATYGVEQKKSNGQVTQTTHRLGGEVQLTDKLSIGAEKGISTTLENTATTNDAKQDEKINVQFRTKF